MSNSSKLTFLGFFIFFPVTFLLANVIWRFFIKSEGFINVVTSSLSILGIYYILASIVFAVMKVRNVNLKDI
ncbi:hypothetical protein AZF06_23680 [Priestia endophytica]|uniref:Uncharacterized protein n=1 Tax=Priestia endophytica DSM 13796 TaxID=1121089 RepID=A0A1I6BUW2_9BACI|nr:hypothetical protein AZF06_23680 [Priestia endophytica]MBG9811116.1 hypothetical protein [Priestia endophytica]RAS91824.1 hypothetical protein A3863_04935 [Priestia endophytica]SFQ84719.1 hypothetical protein SAMN02745910_04263 [Priestia endophytica DSM 13796]